MTVQPSSLIAPTTSIVDAASGETLAGTALTEKVSAAAAAYTGISPGAIFARCGLTTATVLRYLGAFEAGRAIALLDPALAPETLADLIERFQPAAVVGLDEGGAGATPGERPKGYRAVTDGPLGSRWEREEAPEALPHPDLAVLLATSGSTGNPKLVRLSRAAIAHNAASIATALHIDEREVAPTSLPFFYSYGMSVLNSHLVAGARVVVADGGVLSRDFWKAFDAHGATSLAGVPYNYEMLHKIRWKPAKHPTLRTLTQAGGRLRLELIEAFHDKISEVGGGLYVMWGTTEAAPRMTTLPADRLPEKLGSVGPPLDGGRVVVLADDGTETTEPGVTGELAYRGPNVMMGYAERVTDLAKPDETGGVLRTGDLGHLDDEGFVWVTGRLKRIGKVFGVRVSLDDIEQILRDAGPVAAVAGGEKVVVFCENADDERRKQLTDRLAERLKLHRSGFDVREIDELPLLPSGKINYRALEARV